MLPRQTLIALVVCALGLVATLATLTEVARLGVLSMLWAALPYIVLGVCLWHCGRSAVAATTGLIGTVICTAFGVLLMVSAVSGQHLNQMGLAFVFLPLYQLLGVVVVCLLSCAACRRSRARDERARLPKRGV